MLAANTSVNATSQSCNGWSIRIYHLTVDANCLDYLKLEIDKLTPGLAVSSAKRKLPEETAEEMEGKKHFLPWKKRKKWKKWKK